MKITSHALRTANLATWRYFHDQYEGGPGYCLKSNPLAYPIPPIPGQTGNVGASYYLIQQGLESTRNYAIRINETPCVPICSQVTDFYCSTVGKPSNITLDAEQLVDFLDDADLQGQSLVQWLGNPRINAAVYGHTFIVVDMTRAQGEIITQADVQAEGLQPYVYEITPPDMINWRLDGAGHVIEAIYRARTEPTGSILEETEGGGDKPEEFLYWSTSEWKRLRKTGESTVEVDGGPNPTELVPITPLYHRRKSAWMGESLIRNAAHMQHTAVNWLSDMLQNLRMTMYAQPVLESNRTLDQVAVGSAALMQLDPDGKEKFSYVTPDSQPFKDAWEAFYRWCDLARATMGFSAGSAESKPEQKSGISKAWDFFEAEKIMAQMALNEQEAVKSVLFIASRWMGQEFAGNVQYATTFDMATALEDVEVLIALQAAQVPTEAQKEIMRRAVQKLLPSMAPATQKAIMDQIDQWRAAAEPALTGVGE